MKRSAVGVGLLLGLQFVLPPLMARTLKVGVSGSSPFVIQNNGARNGISIDIWRKIAEENNTTSPTGWFNKQHLAKEFVP